jgi:hypothetical protein
VEALSCRCVALCCEICQNRNPPSAREGDMP